MKPIFILAMVFTFFLNGAAHAEGLFGELHSISFGAKLIYHTSKNEEKTMGSVSGDLYDVRNLGVHLKLDGVEYPVAGGFVTSAPYSQCSGDMDSEDRPEASVRLAPATVEKIMAAADNLIWRAGSTKRHVATLIKHALNGKSDLLRYSGSYCAHVYFNDIDLRVSTFHFADAATGESIDLVLKIGRSVSITDYGTRRGD